MTTENVAEHNSKDILFRVSEVLYRARCLVKSSLNIQAH